MNEQDFDKQIKETALEQETQSEKPLWNKNATWNRIESGLPIRNGSAWWKVAALILLLFSLGFSYAQSERFRNYKNDKELQLNELKQKIGILAAEQQNLKSETQIQLREKTEEIDELKNQLLLIKTNGRTAETHQAVLLQRNLLVALQKQNDDRTVIDSLKHVIQNLRETTQKPASTQTLVEQATTEQKLEIPEPEIAPERQTYYISNHFQPKNPKGKKGFKIELFGSPESKSIEYQSDYSIFKK